MTDVEPTGRRSVLCVPGDDPAKVRKALAAGADEVVVDLEDAVAPDRKEQAREALPELLRTGSDPRVAVRVNALGSPWHQDDLAAVARVAAVARNPVRTVVLPKAGSRADIAAVEGCLDDLGAAGVGIQALVETAAGVARLPDLVADPVRLESLIIGYADLAASLGRDPSSDWRWVQETVLVHGRAAGLEVVDGPYLGVAVDAGFEAAVRAAADLGFDAKWAIHPRQVPGIGRLLMPPEAAVVRARAVLDAITAAQALGVGAIRMGDALVDEAMAVAARRVLARSGR